MKATLGNMATIAISLCLLGASWAEASNPPSLVVTWGDNSHGQTNVPAGLSNVVAIAVSGGFDLALKSDGTVAAWGDYFYSPNGNIPMYVPAGLTNVTAIAAGVAHALALKSDGSVVAWGDNTYGETSVPAGLSNVVAIAAGDFVSLVIKSDSTVVAWGLNYYGETNVPAGLSNVVAISVGQEFGLALKNDGTVSAWGKYSNNSGYVPIYVPPGLNNVKAIAAGGSHALALKNDGAMVAWGGYANDGVTYVPAGLSNVVAIAAGACNLAQKVDGTIVAWGDNSVGELNIPAGMANIVAIAAGGGNAAYLAPIIILPQQAPSTSVALGTSTNFSVTMLVSGPFSSMWSFNGVPIAGATGTNIVVGNINQTKAGLYSITVSNLSSYFTVRFVLRLNNSPVVLVDKVDVGGGSVSRIASSWITMTNTGSGAEIYYTLDGSTPNFLSLQYHGPFQLTQPATIRALAYDSAYVSSAEAAPITVEVVPIYRLISLTPGGGSMAFSPAAYSGGDYFISNTAVTITATPSSGWSFLGWLGDAAGPNPMATLTMTRDMAVQALFGTAVTSNALGAGQIWFARQVPLYPYGTTLAVAAIPQTGSYLINWAGALSGSNNPNVLVVTTPNPIITALFGSLSAGRYALTVLPQGAGSVTVSPYTNRYASGTVVTVTAVPGSGQTFTGWSGDASGAQNPLTVTMTQSKVITANFTSRPTLSTAPPLNRMAEQGFRFSLFGELGMASRIDGSSDLLNWIPLGWLTNDFGTSQFLDPAALTNAAQFYRAVTQ